MAERSARHPRRWLMLAPEAWRTDLLRITLGFLALFGTVVYVPSVVMAFKSSMYGVIALDTAAIVAVYGVMFARGLPAAVRAFACCLVLYSLGAGLMVTVGSISQIYLFGFSLLTTLLLSTRWGLASMVLNVVTMLVIGMLGIQMPEMVVPHWAWSVGGWLVITSNFAMVNSILVLALGAVIGAMERALEGAVAARIGLEIERKALVAANEALCESKALLRIAGLTARLGGWRVPKGGHRVQWSDEVCELHEVPAGTSPSLADGLAYYVPGSRPRVVEAMERCFSDGTPFDLEAHIISAKGTDLWVRVIGHPLRDAHGLITDLHGSIQDITPQKKAEAQHEKLETQLRQAQKLETLGGLAGGVAHDFNNLMSIVLSYSELLASELKADDPMVADLHEIRDAGRRAAELTKQLLAFSRQQVLQPKVIDLAQCIAGMENMLRRLIGEDIDLSAQAGPGRCLALVDPGQMEQIIMNLAVNARDAMPQGGLLTIETAEVLLDAAYAAEHVGVVPGPHVMLAVSDTGTGMDKATQARMFEPFFTTKERGKGTGLGLATVFGIVQQSGGTIWVYSELGKGTTFKLYFPLASGAVTEASDAPVPSKALGGTETILVVEDEERLRLLTSAILRRAGYTVLEAQNAGEAFLVSEQVSKPIHLLLTDVVMPRMSGRQLAERLSTTRPEMKVLFMSGYTDDAVVRHGILSATLAFIQKPITPEPLMRKVRSVLDQ